MTIYFAGQTVMDFDEIDALRPSLYSDEPTHIQILETADSEGNLFKDLNTTTEGVVFLSFDIVGGGITTSTSSDFSLSNIPQHSTTSFWDSEGNNIFFGGFNENSGNFEGRIQLRDGTTEDATMFPNGLHQSGNRYTFRIEPGVGLKAYVNGSLVYEFAGDIGNSLSTTNIVGRFGIGNGDNYAGARYANILCADFDTRFASIEVVNVSTTPTTNTSSSGDATLTPQIVDEYTRADYEQNHLLTFDADGEKVIYTENNTITVPDGNVISAVVMNHSGFETGASPVPNLTPILEINATEYTGTPFTLGTGLTVGMSVFENNPATSSAWTVSDLDGIGYGFSLNT